MIQTAKAAGPIDHGDVLRLFDDADHAMVAARIAAQSAGIRVGDVVADGAVGDAILDVADRLAQPLRVLSRRAQDVERKALRALGPHTGKFLELVDQFLKRSRE